VSSLRGRYFGSGAFQEHREKGHVHPLTPLILRTGIVRAFLMDCEHSTLGLEACGWEKLDTTGSKTPKVLDLCQVQDDHS
jgi:hypothetical protein